MSQLLHTIATLYHTILYHFHTHMNLYLQNCCTLSCLSSVIISTSSTQILFRFDHNLGWMEHSQITKKQKNKKKTVMSNFIYKY